jgi:hypothetical protein
LLAGARELLDDDLFWRHQSRGLAVFAAPGLFQRHRLPIEVPEIREIGRRPHVKPLLPLLADDGRFFVLAASAGDTRLYAGSRFGLSEVEADLPRSVAEVGAETDYENMRHAAPPARPRVASPQGMPSSHNFGETPEEMRKAQLVEHLRRVHNALEEHLGGKRSPIVLVAQPEVQGHLRALATGITFEEAGIQADPASLDEAGLHERAYAVVQPRFARIRDEARSRFEALAGDGDTRGAADPAAIVSGARFGRVDTLLLAEGAALWGTHDEAGDQVRIERGPSPANEDLLDYAAVQTLLQGGHVHVLPPAEIPRGLPMAAIFRF